MTLDRQQEQSLVLIIEDDPLIRLLFRGTLEALGLACEESGEGNDGLEKARSAKPDLIIVDLYIPGLDGISLCQQLRDYPACKRIPILLVTGSRDQSSIDRAMRSGANDCLTKPVDLETLCDRVTKLLENSGVANGSGCQS